MYRNQYKNSTSVVLFEEPIESYGDFFIHMDMIHVQRICKSWNYMYMVNFEIEGALMWDLGEERGSIDFEGKILSSLNCIKRSFGVFLAR